MVLSIPKILWNMELNSWYNLRFQIVSTQKNFTHSTYYLHTYNNSNCHTTVYIFIGLLYIDHYVGILRPLVNTNSSIYLAERVSSGALVFKYSKWLFNQCWRNGLQTIRRQMVSYFEYKNVLEFISKLEKKRKP